MMETHQMNQMDQIAQMGQMSEMNELNKMNQKNTTVVLKRKMKITLTMVTRAKNPIMMKNYRNWKKIQPVEEKGNASSQLWMELHHMYLSVSAHDSRLCVCG